MRKTKKYGPGQGLPARPWPGVRPGPRLVLEVQVPPKMSFRAQIIKNGPNRFQNRRFGLKTWDGRGNRKHIHDIALACVLMLLLPLLLSLLFFASPTATVAACISDTCVSRPPLLWLKSPLLLPMKLMMAVIVLVMMTGTKAKHEFCSKPIRQIPNNSWKTSGAALFATT